MELAKDLAVVGVSALLTALAAGPLVVPGAASAGSEEAPLLGALLEPKPFDANGVGLSIDLDPETCRPGEKLAATLSAVNRKDGEEERRIKILMHVTQRASPMARMPAAPKQAWATELTIHLAAGETKSVAIRPEIPVQEGERITFSIEADGGGALLARYSAAPASIDVTPGNLVPLLPTAKREPS